MHAVGVRPIDIITDLFRRVIIMRCDRDASSYAMWNTVVSHDILLMVGANEFHSALRMLYLVKSSMKKVSKRKTFP